MCTGNAKRSQIQNLSVFSLKYCHEQSESTVPTTTFIAPSNLVLSLQSSPIPAVHNPTHPISLFTTPGSPRKTPVGSSARPVTLGPKVLNHSNKDSQTNTCWKAQLTSPPEGVLFGRRSDSTLNVLRRYENMTSQLWKNQET